MQGNIFILIVGLVFIPSTKASSECDLCVDLVEAIEGFILAGRCVFELEFAPKIFIIIFKQIKNKKKQKLYL